MSDAIARQPGASVRRLIQGERRLAPRGLHRLPLLGSRLLTFAIVELQKLSQDRTELVTRAIQPMLWLLIFGETFSRVRAINTGNVPYLSFLAPGIIAQSALFISIFYGIQIIWDRDAGILSKLLVTPTPRTALIAGKAFAAGIRSIAQVLIIVALCLVMQIRISFQSRAHPRRGSDRLSWRGVFLMLIDDAGRTHADSRPHDGHWPSDHDATVLRLQCALSGQLDACLGSGAQRD